MCVQRMMSGDPEPSIRARKGMIRWRSTWKGPATVEVVEAGEAVLLPCDGSEIRRGRSKTLRPALQTAVVKYDVERGYRKRRFRVQAGVESLPVSILRKGCLVVSVRRRMEPLQHAHGHTSPPQRGRIVCCSQSQFKNQKDRSVPAHRSYPGI